VEKKKTLEIFPKGTGGKAKGLKERLGKGAFRGAGRFRWKNFGGAGKTRLGRSWQAGGAQKRVAWWVVRAKGRRVPGKNSSSPCCVERSLAEKERRSEHRGGLLKGIIRLSLPAPMPQRGGRKGGKGPFCRGSGGTLLGMRIKKDAVQVWGVVESLGERGRRWPREPSA